MNITSNCYGENKSLKSHLSLGCHQVQQKKFLSALVLQIHPNKSASLLNPVTLMGGIDYESAKVILTGLQSGKKVLFKHQYKALVYLWPKRLRVYDRFIYFTIEQFFNRFNLD